MERPSWPERKRIRLPGDAYALVDTAWLVTIGTHERRPVFLDRHLGHGVCALFVCRCETMGASLDALCLMPDHAHLLVRLGPHSLVDIVRDAKSRSTRLWWSLGGTGKLWQRSFHDRGLRAESAWNDALAYVLENPQRAGLVEDWRAYPLLGGWYAPRRRS